MKYADTKAWDLAVFAHGSQVDKAGQPYTLHLRRVARRVSDYADVTSRMSHRDQVTLIAIAYLHDILEDTEVTVEDLRTHGFSKRIIDAVCALTRTKGREQHTYYEIVRRNPDALIVKLADIADNSDPMRLALLPQDDRLRLLAKYNNALKELWK